MCPHSSTAVTRVKYEYDSIWVLYDFVISYISITDKISINIDFEIITENIFDHWIVSLSYLGIRIKHII